MLVACSSLSVPEPVCGQLLLDTCSEADLKISHTGDSCMYYVYCGPATDRDLDSCAHCLCTSSSFSLALYPKATALPSSSTP